MSVNKLKRCSLADIALLGAILLTGGFQEYVSCAVSALLSVGLIVRIARQKRLRVQWDMLMITAVVVAAFYGLSCFWAVDPGMAWIGFLKFLPIPLYLLSLTQEDDPKRILNALPYMAAVLTVLSSIAMQFEPLESLFAVSDRLAGVFQYPNTFALFLLVCELLLVKKQAFKWHDIVTALVLIGGLFYTGSRTVFVLFFAANIALLFALGTKKRRVMMAAGIGGVVLAVLLLWALTDILDRYLAISLTESTFVGRVLYAVDALPLFLRHPFGMGYLGYSYAQTAVQSGVYSVAYIHNDWLQIALDIGVVPFVLCVVCAVMYFVKKQVPLGEKIIVATVCLHALFDFDMQFIAMAMLLVLLMYIEEDKPKIIKTSLGMWQTLLVVIALVSIYFCISLALSHLERHDAAQALYPFNTREKLVMLEKETDIESANELADEILAQNTDCYVPYSIKSKYAYSQGSFVQVMENKRTALDLAPFVYEEYEEYAVMLMQGIAAYEKMGDSESANYCKQELIALQRRLNACEKKVSRLGNMIVDKPVTAFPDDIAQYIDGLEGTV